MKTKKGLIVPLQRAKLLQRLRASNLLNRYNISQLANGYTFTNQKGNVYFVYMTEYYLLNPDSENQEDMVKVNHMVFRVKGSRQVLILMREQETQSSRPF